MPPPKSHLSPYPHHVGLRVGLQGIDDQVDVPIVDIVVIINEDNESSPGKAHQAIAFLAGRQRSSVTIEKDLHFLFQSAAAYLVVELPVNPSELLSSILERGDEDTQEHVLT